MSPEAIPSTVAEARARRNSPWRRAFKRRRPRRIWYLCLFLAFIGGGFTGYRLLWMPKTPETRRLLPAAPTRPTLFVEVRDAPELWKRNVDSPTIRALLESPFFVALQESPDWLLLEDALRPKPDAPPRWDAVPFALGEDATFALYPGDEDSVAFLLVGKTHPAARTQLAWTMVRPWWRREWRARTLSYRGVRITQIAAIEPSIYVAFVGRLGFCSNRLELLQAALDLRAGGTNFLSTGSETWQARWKDQPPDRDLSFYSAFPEGKAFRALYGVVRQEGTIWRAELWAAEAAPPADALDVESARRLSLSIPATNPLAFWYSAVPNRWLTHDLPQAVDLAWGGSGVRAPALEGSRAVALTVFPPRGTGVSVVPDIAFLVATPEAVSIRRRIQRGRIRLAWNTRRLDVRKGEVADTLELRIGSGIRYPVGLAATPQALVLGTTPYAAEQIASAPASEAFRNLLPETPAPADLFQLRARPTDLVGAMERLLSIAAFNARMSGDMASQRRIATIRSYLSLVRTVLELEVDGLTVDRDVRLFLRALVMAPVSALSEG